MTLLRSPLALCGLVLLIAAGSPRSAHAEGTLTEAVQALAQDIKTFVDGRGEKSVSVGQFRGSGSFSINSSAGPNLVRELTRALQALKVEVALRSNITVLGDFEEAEVETTRAQVVVLKAEMREKAGKKTELEHRFIKNQAALAVLLGLVVEFPPDAGRKERNEEIKKQIDKPQTYVANARIRAAEASPFAIEVLVAPPDPAREGKRDAKDYLSRKPEVKEGLAFVPIKRDEVYGIRLINDAPYDVAVSLSIDGLSMFVFCEDRDKKTGGPAYPHVIMRAKSTTLIRGWFITLERSEEFKVTEYAKSVAGSLNSSANVGTITACFHAAWDPKESPPPGEPKADAFSQSADATGRGASFEKKYTLVERKTGALRSVISVRYTR